MKPQLIAVAGGSGSGKTWLVERLVEALGSQAARLSLDDFYRDRSHLTLAERKHVNFDHPDALDWPQFLATLVKLKQGQEAKVPQYDFSVSNRRPDWRQFEAVPLVLIDGLWPLVPAGSASRFDLKVFVECPAETRLARRLARDTVDRLRAPKSVVDQFWRHVEPMHQRFVEPQRGHADLLIKSPISTQALVELTDYLKKRRMTSTEQSPT